MKTKLLLAFLIFYHICGFAQNSRSTLDLFNFQQAQQIEEFEKATDKDNIEYAEAANKLAGLYRSIGNFEKAEKLYRETLEIRKNTLGQTHPDYAVSLNNLALLYKDMGNFSRAEELYLKANEIIKNNRGKSTLSYATSLNNLATLYRDFEDYNTAEPLYMEALTTFINILGDEKHILHGITLNNVAVMFREIGNYTAAIPLQNKAIETIKGIAGTDHPSYATAINNLAILHKSMGNHSTAENLFKESVDLRKKTLNKNHPSYAKAMDNFAKLYYNSGNYKKADSLFKKANEIFFYNINQQFGFLTEKEKELYLNTLSERFDAHHSYSLTRQKTNPSIIGETYNNILKTKGLLLKSSSAMRNAILTSNNDELINNYKKWIQVKRQITQLNISESAEKNISVSELENEANELEKFLVRHSTEFSDFDDLLNFSWQDVQKNLKPGEAAIEFTHFPIEKDSIIYCALVLKHDSNYPVMISLFEEKQLKNTINIKEDNSQEYINRLYGKQSASNTELYNLIWQPLKKQLNDINTIYISPSGLLHRISFAAINKDTNHYLLDCYNLRILNTTANAGIDVGLDFTKKPTTTLFGGIKYSITSPANSPWPYLSSTLREVETIKETINEQTFVQLITDKEATVERFKNLAPDSDILHIATHGFFFPDPAKKEAEMERKLKYGEVVFRGINPTAMSRFTNNNDPLMRSGLVFAGVNDYWITKEQNKMDYGVLTALEVININLRNNKLVVMSACETGLGDIVGNEGVYGLQRAFKIAGTNYLIHSLWKIPDRETADFMQTFYNLLIQKNDLNKAFDQTQRKMRQKYDPFFWAAFVLTE